MDQGVLSGEVQRFITDHGDDDPVSLVLKGGEVAGVAMKVIAEQIASRNKLKEKAPGWVATPGVYYPPTISIEQSSSQETSAWKARLFSGDMLLDLTGGLGIDTHAFSSSFNKVVYVERDEPLCDIARNNFTVLGCDNITVINKAAEQYVENIPVGADVFIDPSRRSLDGRKVYRFEDCQPDVVKMGEILLERGCRVLVKASPLLDIKKGLELLRNVSQVHVVAVENECKEVLFLLEKDGGGEVEINAVNLKGRDAENFQFAYTEENRESVEYSEPIKYLYEPNSAILKAGAFRITGGRYGLKKLHPSTHLYTSDIFVDEFPGRIFVLKDVLKVSGKKIIEVIPSGKANVFTRNFNMSAPALRDKLGLRDGGEEYVCGTTVMGGKRVLLWLQRIM